MITNVRILRQFSTVLPVTFSILNCDPKDVLFFDIETTGLSPKTSRVFLIGLISFQPDIKEWQLIQFLLEHNCEEEESQLLKTFSAFVENKSQLIHFNGNSLIFLTSFLAMKSISFPILFQRRILLIYIENFCVCLLFSSKCPIIPKNLSRN